jgi:hypothetical protein
VDEDDEGDVLLAFFVKCEQCGTTVLASAGESVKTCVFPPKERKELQRLAKKHGAAPILADKRERGVIAYSFLGQNGIRPFEPQGIGEYG